MGEVGVVHRAGGMGWVDWVWIGGVRWEGRVVWGGVQWHRVPWRGLSVVLCNDCSHPTTWSSELSSISLTENEKPNCRPGVW